MEKEMNDEDDTVRNRYIGSYEAWGSGRLVGTGEVEISCHPDHDEYPDLKDYNRKIQTVQAFGRRAALDAGYATLDMNIFVTEICKL